MIERAKARAKLIRPLLIPLVLYLIVSVLSAIWLEDNPDSTWRYILALTPLLPGVWIAIGVFKAIKKLDEMEQLVLMEGIVVSFIATFILVISLGFLQSVGFPLVNGIYIGFFMVLVWFIAKLLIHRRLG
jgi:hypothetical protein